MNHRNTASDRLEVLLALIKSLNDEADHGAMVVVEGLRDAQALRSLAYQGNIFLLSHSGGLTGLASRAEKCSKVILLLDLDRTGKSLTKKAALLLEGKRIRFDLFYRRRLAKTLRGDIHQIEELAKYANDPVSPIHGKIMMN